MADPTLTDSDWKEHTKVKLSKQGYGYPPPDMLARALTQVEHALRRTLGPRPIADAARTGEAGEGATGRSAVEVETPAGRVAGGRGVDDPVAGFRQFRAVVQRLARSEGA